jgi:hypothetical protein
MLNSELSVNSDGYERFCAEFKRKSILRVSGSRRVY